MTPKSERNQPAARRGKNVALGIYLVVASGFVILSTWEVQRQVSSPSMVTRKTDPNCSYAVVAFDEAVTRALAHAALEQTRAKADVAFEDVVDTPLAAVEKRCKDGPDVGAFLAASRVREAAEATVDAQQATLAPLRAALLARRNP